MFKKPVIKILNDSTELAISLLDTKNFLKVDIEEDDSLIEGMLKAALKNCEISIGKTLLNKQYQYSIYNEEKSIKIPYGPVSTLKSVKIVTKNNEEILIDEDTYFLDTVGDILNFKVLPNNFYRLDIIYTAGFGETSEYIPEDLKQAILAHVYRMYDERTSYSPLPKITLDTYKKYKQIRL